MIRTMGTGWTHAISHDALRRKRAAVFRHDGKQIALFDTAAGVYACNNRCPHEGNSLRARRGHHLDSCIATSGDNLYGSERLLFYPVEVRVRRRYDST